MLKEFYMLISVVVLLLSFVFVHYVTNNSNDLQDKLSTITKVTNIVSPALSVAYYEPRVLFYEKNENPAYPQMQTINKMDLVYEQ